MDECEAPKRKQGRQTKYTPAKAKEILRRLAGGETLTSICRDMQIPPSTVYQWTVDRNDFAVDFARARDLFQLLLKGCTIEACVRLSLTDCKLSFLDWYNMPIRDLLEWSKILLSELEKVRKLEENAFKKPR